MKRLLLMALCCYFSATVLAQPSPQTLTVKGTAIDSLTNQPIGYGTVALLDAGTKKSVRGGLTKDDGTFELKAFVGKSYLLTFASVGYQPKTIKITGKDAEVNLGRILIGTSK